MLSSMSDLLINTVLTPGAALPEYAKPGDAAMDLRALKPSVIYADGGRKLIPTGLTIEIPDGHFGMVLCRSGLAIKHGISVLNAPGIVDAGYRGDVGVILCNTDRGTDFHIEAGDRIAQIMVLPYPTMAFVAADSLSETDRGVGGFGHTGR